MSDKEKRDAAVDAFAADIKARLDEKAAMGYTGWDGEHPESDLLRQIKEDAEHLIDRNAGGRVLWTIDIGARAMFLHYRARKEEALWPTAHEAVEHRRKEGK